MPSFIEKSVLQTIVQIVNRANVSSGFTPVTNSTMLFSESNILDWYLYLYSLLQLCRVPKLMRLLLNCNWLRVCILFLYPVRVSTGLDRCSSLVLLGRYYVTPAQTSKF
jgi:hypothetical protein